jgi:hypothetical protein
MMALFHFGVAKLEGLSEQTVPAGFCKEHL